MLLNYYDIIVLGTELSGLIAATLLSRIGYKTLIVTGRREENTYTHKGYTFVKYPFIMAGFETAPVMMKVLKELGLFQEVKNRFSLIEPNLQVIMPEHRVNVTHESEFFDFELKREFGDHFEKIRRFYDEVEDHFLKLDEIFEKQLIIPPVSWLNKRRLKNLLLFKTIDESPLWSSSAPDFLAIKNFILGQALFGATFINQTVSWLHLVRNLMQLKYRTYSLKRGIDEFKEVFLDKFKTHNGSHQADLIVNALEVRRGRVLGIATLDKSEMIGGNLIIYNGNPFKLQPLIALKSQNNKLNKALLELTPKYMVYSMNLLLKKDSLPEGMGAFVILILYNSKPLAGANYITITSHPALNPGFETLNICTLLSVEDIKTQPHHLQFHKDEVLRSLKQFFPFLDRFILESDSPWDSLIQGPDFNPCQLDDLRLVYETATDRFLGLSGLNYLSGYKNILFTGRHVLGGMGIEGDFISGISAAQLALKICDKKSRI